MSVVFYEVWSQSSPFTDEPKLEGTFSSWNAPDTGNGAVQCVDGLRDTYYRKGVNALVWIKEREEILLPEYM